jgi:2-phosphosulfolactate phosphatase
MKTRIYQGHAPQMTHADACVAIDVIRAFTTTQVAFSRGADSIWLVGEVEDAFALAEQHCDVLLAGERHAVRVEGFDFGNSPAEMVRMNLQGCTLILTTTNGVRAALHARAFGRTWVCGYRGADAIVAWLRASSATSVNLVASHPDGDEDIACAEYIRGRLEGAAQPTARQVEHRIRESRAAEKFLDADLSEFDPRDIDLCAARVEDGFVMEVVEDDDYVRLVTRRA